jgi:hypothetical protein
MTRPRPPRCPRCGAPTFIGQSGKFELCSSIACPWFLTIDDQQEHFR